MILQNITPSFIAWTQIKNRKKRGKKLFLDSLFHCFDANKTIGGKRGGKGGEIRNFTFIPSFITLTQIKN
jgi:hypothetical protein